MKRFIFIISTAACVLASCVKEAPVGTNGTKVTATVESELTKTVLGEKDGASWPVLWQAGDKIDINGNESAPLAEGGDITAEFSFEAQLTAPFNAIYPASAATGIGTGEIPATHDYTADSFDPDAGVLLGTGDAEGVSFKHAMAYIAFVPQGDGATITSLELTAVGGEKLSGAFTTDYSTLTMSGEASSKVTVNCSTPVALGNEIIAAIPAQRYTQGFKVKFTDSEGGSMEKTAAGSFTAAAGHIYTTTLPYVAESEPDYPETLYMSGGFNGWTAVQLEKIAEGRFQIENHAFNFFNSDEDPKGHGIKFFENIEDWSNQWGPKENWENTEYRGWELAPYADAPQFYPQLAGFESGNYTVLVDFTTMTVSLTEVSEPEYPETLYMSGGFNDWAAVQLEKIAEGRFQIENYAFNFFNSDEDPKGHGIKFFENIADWSNQWGPKEEWENTEYRGWELAPYADAPQFYPQLAGFESGNYTVLVDFTTMELTLTAVEEDFDPAKCLYIMGGPFGWDFTESNALLPVADKIYEGHNFHLTPGTSFKFTTYEWGTEYVKDYSAGDDWTMTVRTSEDMYFVLGDDAQGGKYTIRLDLNTMKVSLTLTEADQITYIYLYGAAFADYTDWEDWIPVPSVGNEIYETTLNLNVGDAGYARGFKIYKAQSDWSNEYCMYSDSTKDNIRFGHKDDTGDNQVIPFNVGYTQSGNYVVRIDFNTMKIIFTKVD